VDDIRWCNSYQLWVSYHFEPVVTVSQTMLHKSAHKKGAWMRTRTHSHAYAVMPLFDDDVRSLPAGRKSSRVYSSNQSQTSQCHSKTSQLSSKSCNVLNDNHNNQKCDWVYKMMWEAFLICSAWGADNNRLSFPPKPCITLPGREWLRWRHHTMVQNKTKVGMKTGYWIVHSGLSQAQPPLVKCKYWFISPPHM
jgi:hypothetical protein